MLDIETEKGVTTGQLGQQYALKFAKMAQQRLVNLEKNDRKSTTFSQFTQENLLRWLKSPTLNEANLRNASICMFNRSPQYRRLISYYALTPRWDYTILPLGFDKSKVDEDKFKAAYFKATSKLERMNIKHEMQKACTIAWREDVFYGVAWESSNAFFLQSISPDICQLTDIVDGCYMFAIDMSKIAEIDLETKYPPEFTQMFSDYKTTGVRYQKVPQKICWCLKCNETTPWVDSKLTHH